MIEPINSEKAVRSIELTNTLTFYVGRKSTKTEIKKEIQDLFKVQITSVNTHIQGNKKIAYITLNKKTPAIDVATKLGMI